jgi:hypothetical protein
MNESEIGIIILIALWAIGIYLIITLGGEK